LLSTSKSDPHSDCNSNTYTEPDTNSYAYGYGDANCNAFLDTYSNSDTYRYGDANSNTHPYSM
jgi:hypothetical protein